MRGIGPKSTCTPGRSFQVGGGSDLPGVSGWRELVAVGYPAWVQPTGAHDAYKVGDRVTFEGADYESTIAGNVWSPAAYPQGWRKL